MKQQQKFNDLIQEALQLLHDDQAHGTLLCASPKEDASFDLDFGGNGVSPEMADAWGYQLGVATSTDVALGHAILEGMKRGAQEVRDGVAAVRRVPSASPTRH